MRVLITGGAGFIGSHLAEKLVTRGDDVVVVDDLNDFYDPAIKKRNWGEVEMAARESSGPAPVLIKVDLCQAAALEKKLAGQSFDQVVHLAARAGVRPSIENPELYVRTNILGTLNLLNWMRDHQLGRLVFASSSSVYGLNEKIPFSENDLIAKTISPYAATKLAGEQLCSNFAHLYGIDTICLRFFTVYGPRQRPDLAIHRFTSRLLGGEKIQQFGDGTTRRDYTYIDDIIGGIVAAMNYRKRFDIFNLGESQTVELRYLISQLEQVLGRKAQIEVLAQQPGDVPVTYADISKARSLLGYTPQTRIEEGLKKFAEWFQKQVSPTSKV